MEIKVRVTSEKERRTLCRIKLM